MRNMVLFFSALFLAILASGCSSNNSDTPLPGEVHPQGWILTHDAEAANLDECQSCHGIDFEGSGEAVSCFSCHVFNQGPPFTVHPDDWSDPYVDHRSFAAANGFASCAIAACHGTDQPTPLGGVAGPSCATATFDGRSCHAGGPAPHVLPFSTPVDHGPEAKADLKSCQLCHGSPGTILFDGGLAETACSSCHPAAGAHPTRWQGTNDNTPGYLSTHRNASILGVTCTICHNLTIDTTPGNNTPGPHPDAPSCFTAGFINADNIASACHQDGPGVGHVLPFTNPALHGPAAKADLTFCQACHGQPGGPGTDPRFNVDIINAGSSGCESCHAINSAHPSPNESITPGIRWFDGTYTHNDAGNISGACTLCHGATLQGGVGQACTGCHTVDPVANPNGCVSCHNIPPDDGAPAGPGRPNRLGAGGKHTRNGHSNAISNDCSVCHANAGFGTAAHFDLTQPADVTPPAGETITFDSDATNTTCNGTCHNKNHNTKTWY